MTEDKLRAQVRGPWKPRLPDTPPESQGRAAQKRAQLEKVQRRLEKRVCQHIHDLALDRAAHVIEDDDIARIERYSTLRTQGDWRLWSIWITCALGRYAGLRAFEIAEITRDQVSFGDHTLAVYGKAQPRSPEEVAGGAPRKEPRVRLVTLTGTLEAILGEYLPLAARRFPDAKHILLRGDGRPYEIMGPLGPVWQLMLDPYRVPFAAPPWDRQRDWGALEHSRLYSHRAVERLLAPMFRDLGLYTAHAKPSGLVATQRERKGMVRNLRHSFATATLEALAKAGVPQVEAVARLQREMGHASPDMSQNYVHLAKREHLREDDPLRRS